MDPQSQLIAFLSRELGSGGLFSNVAPTPWGGGGGGNWGGGGGNWGAMPSTTTMPFQPGGQPSGGSSLLAGLSPQQQLLNFLQQQLGQPGATSGMTNPATTTPAVPAPRPPSQPSTPGGQDLTQLAQLLGPAGTLAKLYGAAAGGSGTMAGSGLGAVGSGLAALTGGLNLVGGIEGGNPLQATGGGLSSIGGLAGLLNNPAIANSLGGLGGLTDAGSGFLNGVGGNSLSTLGDIGGIAGGLGGALGIAGGIQGLVNGTASPAQSALSLGSGALGTYGALNTLLPSVFPSALEGIGSLIGVAPGAAAAAAEAAGVGAGAATGALAGTAGASLVGLAAAPVALGFVGAQVADMLDQQAAAAGAAQHYQSLTRSLPGAITDLQTVPGKVAAFNPGMATPAQAVALLNSLESTQNNFAQSGLWDFLASGQTSSSRGPGAHIDFPQGPGILTSLLPGFKNAIQGEIAAESTPGMTAAQIPQRPGGQYMNPIVLGMNTINMAPNAQGQGGYTAGSGGTADGPLAQYLYAPVGTDMSQMGSIINGATVQGTYGGYSANFKPNAPYTATDWGNVSTPILQRLSALQPGTDMISSINSLVSDIQAGKYPTTPLPLPTTPDPSLQYSNYGGPDGGGGM